MHLLTQNIASNARESRGRMLELALRTRQSVQRSSLANTTSMTVESLLNSTRCLCRTRPMLRIRMGMPQGATEQLPVRESESHFPGHEAQKNGVTLSELSDSGASPVVPTHWTPTDGPGTRASSERNWRFWYRQFTGIAISPPKHSFGHPSGEMHKTFRQYLTVQHRKQRAVRWRIYLKLHAIKFQRELNVEIEILTLWLNFHPNVFLYTNTFNRKCFILHAG